MATITEEYVSFEVAKLLKEKGFDEPCVWSYDPNSASFAKSYNEFKNSELNEYEYSKPTLQMAMKWLRIIHNTNIDIVSVWNQKRFEYQVFVVTPENAKNCYRDNKLYLVHEEACEAAIKYCLENLI